MSAVEESLELARIVAERDLYRTLLDKLRRSVRRDTCGFCGLPVSGPGLCGLPGTHEHEEEQ